VVDPHGRAEHVGDGLAQHLLGVAAGPGHGLVQQPGQLLGAGPPRRWPVPQPGQGVDDQVHDLVAEPPHLVGRQGERRQGTVRGHARSIPPGDAAAHPSGDVGRVPSYPEPDTPRRGKPPMDTDRRPEHLLGVVLDAYWTSLASDPLPALLLTGLLSLAGVLVVLLGQIAIDLAGQLVRALS
jgi:hypothetical protein